MKLEGGLFEVDLGPEDKLFRYMSFSKFMSLHR